MKMKYSNVIAEILRKLRCASIAMILFIVGCGTPPPAVLFDKGDIQFNRHGIHKHITVQPRDGQN